MADRAEFDTSAFLTLTGDELGADQVQAHITDAIAGRIQLHASFVSLTEVEYITLQEEGQEAAQERLAEVRTLSIRWHHSDDALCSAPAKLKAAHRISFADSFVAALAQRLDATLVHKDPEFSTLTDMVKLEMLPPK
mgnify:FL=1